MNSTKAIICALVLAFFMKLFIFDFMIAQGQSMEPAIKNGSVFVVNKLRYGFKLPWRQRYLVKWARPKEGEVIVFITPMGELAVKRCSVTLPDGFIAEGDNQLASYDSRSYGPVPVDNIIGKVLGY